MKIREVPCFSIKGLFILFFFIFFTGSINADKHSFFNEGPLRLVCTHKTEPWVYEDNGEMKGIDYEAFKEVARRLKFDFSVEIMPFNRSYNLFITGQRDAYLLIYYKKYRELDVQYVYDAPMHYSIYYVYVKKGNEFRFNSIKDLYGKKIGKNRGFTISDEFDRAVEKGKIKVEEVELREQNIEKLMAGRIDAFVSNHVSARLTLKDMKLSSEITNLPYPLVKKPVYLAFSKKSKNIKDIKALTKAVTKTIQEIKKDGTYDRIKDRYFKEWF